MSRIRTPIDQMRDLQALQSNPEWQDIVQRHKDLALSDALRLENAEAREIARHRYLLIESLESMLGDRIGQVADELAREERRRTRQQVA